MWIYSKWTWWQWLLLDAVIVIVIIGFTAHIGAIPEYQQICGLDANGNQYNCHSYYIFIAAFLNASVFVGQYHDFIIAVSTIIIAFFTGTLWIATSRQGQIATESIRLAREEFISTHRPRIRVKHIWLTKESNLWGDKDIAPELIFVNHGDSEGFITELRCNLLLVSKSNFIERGILNNELPIPFEPPMRIAPGVTNVFSVEVVKAHLEEHDHWAIRKGTQVLYCIGDIEYRDGMGNPRKTAFCRRFVFPAYPVDSLAINGRFEVVSEDTDFEYQD